MWIAKLDKSLDKVFGAVQSAWAALTLGQGVWGFVPSAFGATVTAAVFRLGEFDPVWTWLAFLGSYLAILTVWSITKSKTLSILTTLVITAGGSYLIHKVYEHYSLELVEPGMQRSSLTTEKGPVVTAVVAFVNLRNPNNFPVWTQLIQHRTSLEGRDTGEYNREAGKITKHGANGPFQIIDDPIKNLALPYREGYYQGRLEVTLRYGRSPDRLNKVLRIQGPYSVLFCGETAKVCNFMLLQDPYDVSTDNADGF